MFFGNINEAIILTANIVKTPSKELIVSILYMSWISILIPMKTSNTDKPIFRKRNFSTIFCIKKNSERSPIIAKILEK